MLGKNWLMQGQDGLNRRKNQNPRKQKLTSVPKQWHPEAVHPFGRVVDSARFVLPYV